jgi:transposase
VISGIMYMLRCGARWRDCPAAYGPYTTIYNRFNRWSRQGIWIGIFQALTGSTGIRGAVALDSSTIKAHRSAAGGKGGPMIRPLAARAAGGRRKSTH